MKEMGLDDLLDVDEREDDEVEVDKREAEPS